MKSESKNETGNTTYKPNLNLKKPSPLTKVEILEEAVKKGTIQDLTDVLNAYAPFEMTARALGLACRYRGVDFVDTLLKHGASFSYPHDTSLQRKYSMEQKTAAGFYKTEYYLLVMPEKFTLNNENHFAEFVMYTPMCGFKAMDITNELESAVLPLNERIRVVKYLKEKKVPDVSFDEMLFWALMRGELDFADALIVMGVNLNETPPTYYDIYGNTITYLSMISDGGKNVYWNSYKDGMVRMKEDKIFSVLERIHSLLKQNNKKILITKSFFDDFKWTNELLTFAVEEMDLSKVNQKKVLETAATKECIGALKKMADIGWISQPEKRDELINFARDNQKIEALAWLLDYKNQTADLLAEEAKAEAKMMRELNEKPDSVTAMKKIWSYKKLEDGTLKITNYKGSETEITVPAKIGKSNVSVIGEYAFAVHDYLNNKNNDVHKNISAVVLPEGITEIEYGAFRNCESLTAVVLPSTLKSIDNQVFAGCVNLTSIVIPDSVTSIGNRTFSGCTNLTNITIPDSVTSIGESAFSSCTSLTDIVIPDSVEHIGKNIFDMCSKLYKDNALISNNILFHMSKNDEMIEIPHGVKQIATGAFYRSEVKKIILPDTVKEIGNSAFCFCKKLTNITIPDSVTSIGEEAFFGCESLTNITIPDSVTSIGDRAFNHCERLADDEGFIIIHGVLHGYCGYKEYVSIPDSVTSIGNGVFSSCTSLTNIVIPDSVTSIGDDAFWGCSSLTNIVIPNGVTSIGDETFHGCSSLTDIVIPDSVTSIGGEAFSWCENLTSIVIPDSVTSIGGEAFSWCENLIIHTTSRSYAETYAKQNNIPFSTE